jgi:hypothetical protein
MPSCSSAPRFSSSAAVVETDLEGGSASLSGVHTCRAPNPDLRIAAVFSQSTLDQFSRRRTVEAEVAVRGIGPAVPLFTSVEQ